MQSAKELRYFLFSQQLTDGVRTTAAVVLPAFILYQAGLIAIGFVISLGAMSVSLTDAPGPVLHRRNGMFITTGLVFVVALVTAFVRANMYALGIEIGIFVFLFSLFQVYGLRATNVGNAAILIMVLTMGRTTVSEPLLYALYIVAGGIWYTVVSLFFYYIRPYRPAQRVLGDCIREVARYLSVKALFYDLQTDLKDDYNKLVAQQQVVHEKQDAVREFFFKTAQIVHETTPAGRRLVATFIHTVDLFEDTTAIYYNYSTLRRNYNESNILQHLATVIVQLAGELDAIGMAVQSNQKPDPPFDADTVIRDLKKRIDAVQQNGTEGHTLILKKILVNIRRMAQRISDIRSYFDEAKTFSKTHIDHTVFISHQSLDPKLIWNNLTLQSTAFKHALRIAVACLFGFALSKFLAYGQHSYWIVMTIAFILKPAFSLTKTRNVERIIGTVAGGVIGVVILYFIKNAVVHFVLLVVFMIGTYTFMRSRYIVMVVCTTAYIIILFQFLNIPFISVVQERVFDTVLGCLIAFSAGYFLFPDWEAGQLHKHMADVLRANATYLQIVSARLNGNAIDKLEYKLARRVVYLQSAALSAAYQRMASEPKRQQRAMQFTQQFLVRNHLLFSNIAHVASLLAERPKPLPHLALLAQACVETLHGILKKLDGETHVRDTKPVVETEPAMQITPAAGEEALLQTNVQFIANLCADIEKTTIAILAA